MEEKRVYQLHIEPRFQALISPLSRMEYLSLEQSIIHNGCTEPIKTWNGYIVDGHNRYEICTRHNIPFRVTKLPFTCREETIAWICNQQLTRKNIAEEMRRFLIGMLYDSEKLLNSRKRGGSGHVAAQSIADENHVSYNTVQKYAMYARALEVIRKKVPDIVPVILSGRIKLSHKSVLELSQLPAEKIRKISSKLEAHQQSVSFRKARQGISQTRSSENSLTVDTEHTVKEMPSFDPDAEIAGLTLTMPSWVSSIHRTRTTTDFTITSVQAKNKLRDNLVSLHNEIDALLYAIKED